MGNRAVITTEEKRIGVYLHWNGGRDSVRAFLTYCLMKGYRSPEQDCYGWARLCQVVGNFFGDGLSVGVDEYSRLDTDNWDNGTYVIREWRIIGREFFQGEEQQCHELLQMVLEIDLGMPERERLGESFITEWLGSNRAVE